MPISFNVTEVKDLMTPHPVLISPHATLRQAAQKMEEIGCGALPVGTEEKLEGILTDRDIVTRALAHGKDPAHTKVITCMTKHVYACNERDTLEAAAEKMHQHKVSRLIVRNSAGKTLGILSFGSILRNDASPKEVASIVKHAAGPVAV